MQGKQRIERITTRIENKSFNPHVESISTFYPWTRQQIYYGEKEKFIRKGNNVPQNPSNIKAIIAKPKAIQ